MAVRTHHSKWRGLIAVAPLIAIGILVFAFVQGEHDIFKSRGVQQALLAVAALGTLVATWTAWRLGSAPAVSVAQALPGRVSLRGRAQALANAAPLLSPDGAPCLWFTHSQQVMHRYDAFDSVRPFLLVDGSGQCVVLPAGAEITGSSKITVAKSARLSDASDITGRGTAGYGTGGSVRGAAASAFLNSVSSLERMTTLGSSTCWFRLAAFTCSSIACADAGVNHPVTWRSSPSQSRRSPVP